MCPGIKLLIYVSGGCNIKKYKICLGEVVSNSSHPGEPHICLVGENLPVQRVPSNVWVSKSLCPGDHEKQEKGVQGYEDKACHP